MFLFFLFLSQFLSLLNYLAKISCHVGPEWQEPLHLTGEQMKDQIALALGPLVPTPVTQLSPTLEQLHIQHV